MDGNVPISTAGSLYDSSALVASPTDSATEGASSVDDDEEACDNASSSGLSPELNSATVEFVSRFEITCIIKAS